ncbi:MAG: hypothetical protein E7645_05990 [Ruminococcaceae bacterium]|nr:hypothetical protein [Oscillospiraceae bacterium]
MRLRRRGIQNAVSPLWRRIKKLFRKFSRLPEDGAISEEPIDFSAPSVPYYTGLAERFNLARIVLYMVLFVFVVVTLFSSRHLITYENLYYLVKDVSAATLTAQSEADYLNYPISDAHADFALYRGGLVVAGGQEITVISGSGKQTLSDNVQLSSPRVRAGERYFLTFSRGEKGFSVYNAFVKLKGIGTEYPVYDACMARDGAFAILTRSTELTSVVRFYNEDIHMVAEAGRTGYVTAMDISTDGRTLGLLSLSLEEEGYVTKLTFLCRTDATVTQEDVILTGTTALAAGFVSEDRLAVIFEDRICIYRTDGRMLSESSFADDRPALAAISEDGIAILCRSGGKLTETSLKAFDKNGNLLYNVAVDHADGAEAILRDGEDVYIQARSQILLVADEGRTQINLSIHRDTSVLLSQGNGRILACGPAFARRIHRSDFT